MSGHQFGRGCRGGGRCGGPLEHDPERQACTRFAACGVRLAEGAAPLSLTPPPLSPLAPLTPLAKPEAQLGSPLILCPADGRRRRGQQIVGTLNRSTQLRRLWSSPRHSGHRTVFARSRPRANQRGGNR